MTTDCITAPDCAMIQEGNFKSNERKGEDRVKRTRLAGILILCILILGLCACDNSNHEEVVAGTTAFALLPAEGSKVLEGWDISSYENAYVASVSQDGVARLTLESGDDVRYVRSVEVSSNTRYILSAQIKTENVEGGRGANLSIDNYSIDKCCVYSDSLYGDNDWTPVSLYFETGDNQTEVVLALRLGGYSENSTGTVYFKDVTLDKGTESGATYQMLTPWGSGSDEAEEEAREWDEQTYKSLFSAILWAAVLSAVIMLFCLYRNREKIESWEPEEKTYKKVFAAILLFGLVLRLVLCLIFKGHDTDMNCFIAWGQSIAKEGTSTFYTAAGHEWYDYPPGYMLFLGGWSSFLNLFGVEVYGSFGRFLYMLPAIVADFGCAALLMQFTRAQGGSRGKALLLGGLVYLNPALFFLSGAWGQIDSILTFFLILSFLLLYREKRILSGLVFGIAVSLKWQALMFGPVYALFHLFSLAPLGDKDVWKKLSGTLLGAVAAFGAILLISLPFKGEQDFFWLVNKFLTASSGYDYASVEAYNFMALIGGNWASAQGSMLDLPFTYKQFGTFAIVLAVVLGIAATVQNTRKELKQNQNLLDNKGHMFLTAALVMTLIFTFGHYMHERYIVPVLVLLFFAYAAYGDRRILVTGMLLSAITFLNEMTAMYVVSNAAMSIVRGSMEHNWVIHLCSLAEVGVCLYLMYLCLDIWLPLGEKGHRESRLNSPQWNKAVEEVLSK